MTAIQKIEDYKIPTPYKEILIALVNRKEGYEALDYLAEKFSIHMGYWTYGRVKYYCFSLFLFDS